MDHPNIAQVLDAGATPEGRPYFVMGLIEVLIHPLLRRHRLTALAAPRPRSTTVCRAVGTRAEGDRHAATSGLNIWSLPLQAATPIFKVIDFVAGDRPRLR